MSLASPGQPTCFLDGEQGGGTELLAVGPIAGINAVVASVDGDRVITIAAVDAVVAAAAAGKDGVVPQTAQDPVGAAAAVDGIVADAPSSRVISMYTPTRERRHCLHRPAA
jgi:hypothetical protein